MATDMREHIKKRTDLAVTYAKDGAYFSAAKILGDLAAEARAHAYNILGGPVPDDEMTAALRAASEVLVQDDCPMIYAQVQAALAKAEGRT